jgi:hypothetical protein
MQKIENITQYLKVVHDKKTESEKNENFTDLLFRGQNTDKDLFPKIARIKLKGKIKNIEKLMLDEFKRAIVPLSEFKPEDEWDLLALAQHHGLPTRLLDWTYNPLVALWFAVFDINVNENAVVWIFNADKDDFRNDTDKIQPLSNKVTKIYRPKIISRRISSQNGVFSVHKINNNDKFIAFNKNKNYKNKLTKIIIESKHFSQIKKDLDLLGINNSTIFPDIDGLCKHLEYRFTHENIHNKTE